LKSTKKMLSIIVSSHQQKLFDQLSENVEKTIGDIPFEIIQIWNPGIMGICAAYNKGAEKAKYPYLCFLHEDVLFHTQDWGHCLINHFKDDTIGLLGVAGGTVFPNCPATWWNNTILNKRHLNIIQHNNKKQSIMHDYANPIGKKIVDVVALDGVFICARKEIFKKGISFDNKTFEGFHCYDTDICFQTLNLGYRVVVIFDIMLEHFSMGAINISWLESAEKLSNKWKNSLPLFTYEIDKSLLLLYNHNALLEYSYLSKREGISDKIIRNNIKKYYKSKSKIIFYKQSLRLWLWMHLGYNIYRYIYPILKYFLVFTKKFRF